MGGSLDTHDSASLLLWVRMLLLRFESNAASNKKDGRCQQIYHNDLCIGLSACQYMGAKSSVPGEWSSITVYRRSSTHTLALATWFLLASFSRI